MRFGKRKTEGYRTPMMYLREHLEKATATGSGCMCVYEIRRPGMRRNARLLAEIDAREALNMIVDLEGFLLEKLGDGRYDVKIYGRYGEIVSNTWLAVGDPRKPERDREDAEARERKELAEMGMVAMGALARHLGVDMPVPDPEDSETDDDDERA